MARSDENKLNTDLMLYPFLFIPPVLSNRKHQLRATIMFRDAPEGHETFCATCNSLFSPKDRTRRKVRAIRQIFTLPHSLGHNDRHLLLGGAAAPVLPDDHDGVLARLQ